MNTLFQDVYKELNNNSNSMENILHILSTKLMNEYYLKINDIEYQLIDIEFYINHINHNDIYTHCNERQKLQYQWYLHRKSKLADGQITSGYRKGLDFVFGDNKTFAGLLIRAIRRVDDKCITIGPSLTVDKILHIFNINTLEQLSKDIENKLYSNTLLIFEKKDIKSDYYIYPTTRYGLGENDKEYYQKKYRFILIDNNTNGIKEKTKALQLALQKEMRTIDEIRKDVGYKINIQY